MLRQGDTVAVGVSGGADSVALLCFLYENRARWNLTLRVCHLNHSLRGEESLRDQRFVEDLARDLGLEFCLAVADAAGEARLRGLSVEEAARELGVAPSTVCRHLQAARGRLGDLAARAGELQKLGFIESTCFLGGQAL